MIITRLKPLTLLAIVSTILTLSSCQPKASMVEEEPMPSVLNEATVSSFASGIANGVLFGNAAAFNDVIDREHIKTLVSENSIVYSGFDVEGGEAYFEHAIQLGDQAVQAVDNGGDFAFVHYYEEGTVHHAVFRLYNNYIVDFYDCVVDTVNGQLMIEDCYVYSLGANLSENVKYNMLYNLLLQTNPDSDVHWLREAEELTKSGKHQEAVKLLEAHKDVLMEYPLFHQLYIVNLYQRNPKTFIAQMNHMKDVIDPRYKLFHELHCYYARGDAAGAEQVANELIPYTGDDPIYLFLLGQAYQNSKQYDKAVECYKILDEAMPLFWDLWQSELHCYKTLGDTASYRRCVLRGEEEFGKD